MSTYQHLKVERREHIAIVTMNRPDKANALNYDHLLEIEDVALSFREDGDTRVVIFEGAGKHFSSGADLTDPGPFGGEPLVMRRRHARMGGRTIRALLDMDQVTIAAWTGAAMGGGACVATALDFRVGGDNCFMCYPEISIGVNLMWWSLPLITRLAGPARAKRLVIGGERIPAVTLEKWGVLDELVETDKVTTRALELAEFYAGKPPVAAQMIKRSVNAISAASDEAIMHMDFDQNILNQYSEDSRIAREAYMSGTEPSFKGN
ncbi:MAG: enoyl-CoA hydratase/isomerase family protein [Pseudomonadota bacterium]